MTLVAASCLLRADDQPAQTPPGYHTSTVKVGGRDIQVQEYDPYHNVKPAPPSDGKYHPSEMDFSATSPFAEKKFASPSDVVSKGDPDFQNSAKSTFFTKSYSDANASLSPDLSAKAKIPTTGAYSRSATGFEKPYVTSNADAGQNRPALFASAKSADQDRTAVVGGQSSDAYETKASFADKTFAGPEADALHRHLSKLGNGQTLVTDLPNRPLTIDEVRNLINHGFKPDTDAKPGEASKPLNDPNYQPEPLRATPLPDPSDDVTTPSSASDDDKNDPVPPPGTMAAPENSDPLPQR